MHRLRDVRGVCAPATTSRQWQPSHSTTRKRPSTANVASTWSSAVRNCTGAVVVRSKGEFGSTDKAIGTAKSIHTSNQSSLARQVRAPSPRIPIPEGTRRDTGPTNTNDNYCMVRGFTPLWKVDAQTTPPHQFRCVSCLTRTRTSRRCAGEHESSDMAHNDIIATVIEAVRPAVAGQFGAKRHSRTPSTPQPTAA